VWRRIENDDELLTEIANSDAPAARRFTRWLCHDLLPALDPLGRRGPPGAGDYEWPGEPGEFEAMVEAAVAVTRPAQ
jgi:hypothetical protein